MCCVVLCLVRPSVVVVLRPSVAVVRRRRPLSVRPSRPSCPSVAVVRRPSLSSCESKAACNFLQTLQHMRPTATGLGASDRARSGDFFSRPEIAVRVEKVGFTAETLLL